MIDETRFESIVKQLDQAETDIDDNTLARLRQIRANAIDRGASPSSSLSSTPHPSSSVWMNWMMPALSVSATAIIAILAVNIQLMSPEQQDALVAMNDLEIITAEQDLALYQDLEFYEWLAYEDEMKNEDLG